MKHFLPSFASTSGQHAATTSIRVAVLASVTLAISASAAPDFQKDILPILQQRCVECHGPDKQKGKLRLDSKEATFKGGKDGPALTAGDAAASEMIKRVSLPKSDDDHMPPEGDPLTEAQITLLKEWIAAGANWPDGVVISPPAKAETTAAAPVRQGPPPPPLPELPKDFKPGPAEATAVATLAKAGLEVRPVAQNVPWREANFRLAGSNVTDAAIAPLKDVTSLIELNLGTTRVTDAGLVAVASLGFLQNFQAPLTALTDAGIAKLTGLSNLVTLNLYGTQVTDAGLEQLKGLKHLRALYVWQTKVTPEGAAKLREAMPGLYVNTGAELLAMATNAPAEKKEEKKEDKK
ncbi:MAG TPA: hypothetical protein PLX89_00530 [Verrucomicrobiota bacterium]|nr:hypothetical protein [Verrucomicrobiales bacterium]HRI11462.1 hypothetical protein [Verrucomicrobiota bacterium]